jgi:uncharacterized small protein (DUF1192 family)
MALFDDEPVTGKRRVHEIGTDLTHISADELDERIGELRAEIERLEAERERKTASRAAADSFFR